MINLKNKIKSLIFNFARVISRELIRGYKIGKLEAYDHFSEWSLEQMKLSTKHFSDYYGLTTHLSPEVLRTESINKAIKNSKSNSEFFIELGVHEGRSINQYAEILIKSNREIHGFDSFEGLREDWRGATLLANKAFNLEGKLPKVSSNVILHKGWIQEQIPKFIQKYNLKTLRFLSLDLDTYQSTKDALDLLKPYLVKNSIIMFDEIQCFAGWQTGEYKALNETFNSDEYEFVYFARNGACATIRLL